MCRNIKTLYNFEPGVTDEEIKAAAVQFVRKISGFNKPSKANEDVFDEAVEEIALAAKHLLYHLQTDATPKNREVEREKARLKNEKRFGANNIHS